LFTSQKQNNLINGLKYIILGGPVKMALLMFLLEESGIIAYPETNDLITLRDMQANQISSLYC
jgi:hypothetical protein